MVTAFAGLTAPWFINPGVELGLRRDLEAPWALHAGVDLGLWVNPQDSRNLQLTPQVGWSWASERGPRVAAELGLGLIAENRILTRELDLATGASTPSRSQHLWLAPQAGVRLSWRHHRRLPRFVGLSVGQALSPSESGSTVVTLDFGLEVGRW